MSKFQLDDFVAGWIGGAASVVVGHPLDTVKTRLQVAKGYRSTFHCVQTIYRYENVTGFFKGMSFPLFSIAFYNSLVFGVFNSTQRHISQYRYEDVGHALSLLELTVASAVTGFVSVGIGAPVDLVKIRLQMQMQPLSTANLNLVGGVAGRAVDLPNQRAFRGPIQCIIGILRQNGLLGMYRGARAMILRDIPGYCLYFVPYTQLCRWFTKEGHSAPSPFAVWLAGGMAGAISWGTATPMDVVKSRLQADGVQQNKYRGVLHCIYHSYQTEGIKPPERNTVQTVRAEKTISPSDLPSCSPNSYI
nr:PREDICTED: solute carrier family 25 member 48 isoform X2 [Latimeria chalumnae]|eukprot:XP_005999816.1 PREDICTED: solute carrier family 25 member 48 isoform X2 [Latimeria chalumnae]